MDARSTRQRRFPGDPLPPAPERTEEPSIDALVVEWLERQIPEVAATVPCDHGSLMYQHGMRQVVRLVRAAYERQQREGR